PRRRSLRAARARRAAPRDRLRGRRARRACARARRACARVRRGAGWRAPSGWADAPSVLPFGDSDLGRHRRRGRRRRVLHAELLADLRLDLVGELGVLLEVVARVVLALADAVLLVLVPGARLVDDALG